MVATLLYILVLQQLHVLVLSQDGECLYFWLQEPPYSTLECNPWSLSAILRLQCQASVPASATAEIHWFFDGGRITASAPQIREITDEIDSSDSNRIILTSTAALGNYASGLLAGNYYCRILVGGNYTSTTSNSFPLPDEAAVISRQPCDGIEPPLFLSSNRCAGNANISLPTTQPSLLTTPPSSTLLEDCITCSTTSATHMSTDDFLSERTSSKSTLTSTEADETAQDEPFQMWLIILLAAVIAVLIIAVVALSVGLCVRSNKIGKRKVSKANFQIQLHSPDNLETANETLPTPPDYDSIYDVITTNAQAKCADAMIQDTALDTNLDTTLTNCGCALSKINIDARPNQADAAFENGKLGVVDSGVADVEDVKNLANVSHEGSKQAESTIVTCAHNPAYALLGEPDKTDYQNVVEPWSYYIESQQA